MEQTKEKTKEYFFKVFDFLHNKDLKNRLIKLCIIIGLAFLAELNSNFQVVALCTTIAFIIFEWSPSSVIWACVAGIFSESIGIQPVNWAVNILCVEMIVKFLLDCMAKNVDYKNWKFKTLAVLYFALILLLLLPLATEYKFGAQFRYVPFFTLIVLMILYVKQINIKQFLYEMVFAIVIGCLVLELASACGGLEYTYTIQYSKGVVNRFAPFLADPNFTGSVLLIGMACAYILHRRDKINEIMYYTFVGVLGTAILMTISKATILILGLLALYILIENIVRFAKTKNKKYLIELAVYLVIVVFVCALKWKYVDAFVGRFLYNTGGWWSDSGNGMVDEITTGRFSIWKEYLKAIFSNPRVLLVGMGTSCGHINGCAAHSTPLAYLYEYGLLICGLLVAIFIIGFLPYLKKCKIYNFVPSIILWGIMSSIGSTRIKYFYLFVVTYLTIVWNGVEGPENEPADLQTFENQSLEENVK